MKVLMVNGSAHQKGNTFLSLEEVGKALKEEGIDYEIFQLGGGPIRDCIGCGQCSEKAVCSLMTRLMNLWQKPKKLTDLCSERQCIMHIQADESFLSWTEFFTAAAGPWPLSRGHRWLWQEGAEQRRPLM